MKKIMLLSMTVIILFCIVPFSKTHARLHWAHEQDIRAFKLLEALQPAFNQDTGCAVSPNPANSQHQNSETGLNDSQGTLLASGAGTGGGGTGGGTGGGAGGGVSSGAGTGSGSTTGVSRRGHGRSTMREYNEKAKKDKAKKEKETEWPEGEWPKGEWPKGEWGDAEYPED